MKGPVIERNLVRPGRHWLSWTDEHGVAQTRRVLVVEIDGQMRTQFCNDRWVAYNDSNPVLVANFTDAVTLSIEIPDEVPVGDKTSHIIQHSDDAQYTNLMQQMRLQLIGLPVVNLVNNTLQVITEVQPYYVRIGTSMFSSAALQSLFVRTDFTTIFPRKVVST